MALYPSLEDMKVGQIQQAQQTAYATYLQREEHNFPAFVSNSVPSAPPPDAFSQSMAMCYPSLADEYMGLKLEPPSQSEFQTGQASHNSPSALVQPTPGAINAYYPCGGAIVSAPLSGQDLGVQRSNVTHAVRPVTLCKDEKGKVGLKLRHVNKGVFVQLVGKGSPAALAGLRVGDQILQINGENLAGYTGDKAMDIVEKASPKRIDFAVRDRPFERQVILHKDSTGHVGFQFKNGKITALVKDSSAARNGLLTEHNILEVGGQNVIGLKDAEIDKLINEAGQIVTLTIMPAVIYEHMVKNISDNLIKKLMDHSIPGV